jgi:hypothetical protein
VRRTVPAARSSASLFDTTVKGYVVAQLGPRAARRQRAGGLGFYVKSDS